ncbi:hypothetical protein AB3G45_00605 [Shinella sp. S4-D37]|uniref:hypothetical protein n=1 Tax=Shinella sp. S4-D37 TaxID=3161999 RepID=UPI003466B6AD
MTKAVAKVVAEARIYFTPVLISLLVDRQIKRGAAAWFRCLKGSRIPGIGHRKIGQFQEKSEKRRQKPVHLFIPPAKVWLYGKRESSP